MLTHPTIEKLHALHLTGMARAWEAQRHLPDIDTLSFEEHLGLLLDAETTERDNRRLQTRLRTAALRSTACLEDIDYRHHRGLDRSLMKKLATCQWLHERIQLVLLGTRTPQRAHHRTERDRKKLVGVRARASSVSPRLHRPLPASTALAHRARRRPR